MKHKTEPAFREHLMKLLNANILRQHRDYRAAIDVYLELLEFPYLHIQLMRMIALCSFFIGDYEASIIWVMKALEREPDNVQLHVKLGDYFFLGTLDHDKAIQAYKKALELDPMNVDALLGAAAIYGIPEEVVSLEESILWLERAVTIAPGDPDVHARLAELYQESGWYNEARTQLALASLCPKPLGEGYSEKLRSLLKLTE